MKRVRYLAGALGAVGLAGAVPALGLVTPAAATTAQPPATGGKTVSLRAAAAPASSPMTSPNSSVSSTTAVSHASPASPGSPAWLPPCNARHAHSSKSFRMTPPAGDSSLYKIRGWISYSRDNGCIGKVEGHLYGWARIRGWDMRVRFYNGGLKKTIWLHGKLHSTAHGSHSYIKYLSSPYYKPVQQVCEAIFSDNDTVQITPAVCEQTGY